MCKLQYNVKKGTHKSKLRSEQVIFNWAKVDATLNIGVVDSSPMFGVDSPFFF